MNRALSFTLLAVTAAACSLVETAPQAHAPASSAYSFPHGRHAAEGVTCADCHASIAKATSLEASARHVEVPAQPSAKEACKGCHEFDPDRPGAASTAPFRVRFDHAQHLAKGQECAACHQSAEAGRKALVKPGMSQCTACHEHQREFAEARCTPCHVDLQGLSPETAFKHAGNWLRSHGALARGSSESCAQCHDSAHCASCHAAQNAPLLPAKLYPEQTGKRFIHAGDFLARHSVEAQASPASCRTCHGSASCQACHLLKGVTPGASAYEPHPSGWSTSHGRTARRDIASCAGCHDNGSATLCVSCHRVGGTGGNPHPRSFLRKHQLDDVARNPMCRACHSS
jgi:Cytochrome c7 and related cytochrome c